MPRCPGQLNDSELGHLSRSFRPIRRDHQVRSGPSKPDQLPQGSRPSPRARATNRLVPEPGDDARDHFSIAMPADQDMRPLSAISQRNHELLGMPEREDDGLPPVMQGIDRRLAPGRQRHGPPEQPDHAGAEQGQHGQQQPVQHAGILIRRRPGIGSHTDACTGRRVAAVPRATRSRRSGRGRARGCGWPSAPWRGGAR